MIVMQGDEMETTESDPSASSVGRCLVVVFSYHHGNTKKVADVIGKVLSAPVKTPREVTSEEMKDADLIGIGSGIYSATFHTSMFDLVDRLPPSPGKKAFLFLTYGAPAFVANRAFIEKNHRRIREKVQAKGFMVIGEFVCAGWTTYVFLKYVGGLNRGRPDAGDLKHAEAFARDVLEQARSG